MSEFTELVTEAREIAAIVPTSRAGEVLTGLADAVEALQTQLAAEAEKRRTLAAQYYASAEVLRSRLEKATEALSRIDTLTNGTEKPLLFGEASWRLDQIGKAVGAYQAYRRSEGNNND